MPPWEMKDYLYKIWRSEMYQEFFRLPDNECVCKMTLCHVLQCAVLCAVICDVCNLYVVFVRVCVFQHVTCFVCLYVVFPCDCCVCMMQRLPLFPLCITQVHVTLKVSLLFVCC